MPTQITGKRFTLSILALSLAIGLAGCGSKDDKKPASQVAAKVNAEEISVHQINFVLSRSGAGNVTPEQAPKVRREVLEKLVDQQLAVEQAIEKSLTARRTSSWPSKPHAAKFSPAPTSIN